MMAAGFPNDPPVAAVCTAPNASCEGGKLPPVPYLRGHGGGKTIEVHADDEAGFRGACEHGHLDVVCELLALDGDRRIDVHDDDEAGFCGACRYGHLGVVRELLALDGDRCIESKAAGRAGLLAACHQGHLDVVRELLALDGDRRIDVHFESSDIPGVWGSHPFGLACHGGYLPVVRELLALDGDRRIDVHAGDEDGFREACTNGNLDLVRELLALDGDRRIDVHADEEAGFRKACAVGHLDVVRELLTLESDRRINVHAGEITGFRDACINDRSTVVHELLALGGDRRIDVCAERNILPLTCRAGSLGVVRELLALDGDRHIDVHARGEFAFVVACAAQQVAIVRELLALDDGRRPSLQLVGPSLVECITDELQYYSTDSTPALLALLRDCVIPQSILEAAMKRACAGGECDWPALEEQARLIGGSEAAQAVMHHALLCVLQDTPVPCGAGLLTGGASPALDALALCAVLPGAECRHLVGELGGCGAAVPGGAGRSIGDAFGGYHRACGWRGVGAPVDAGAADVLADVAVGALMCRMGRRGPALRRMSAPGLAIHRQSHGAAMKLHCAECR